MRLGNNFIQVGPSGADDTDNIQCALDLAVERNIPEIRLTSGDFFISSVSTWSFNGSLQGSGRDRTRLKLLPQSIDCTAMEARGELPAAIKFVGGEPRIRWLTLVVEYGRMPCVTGGAWGDGLAAMVHFTGQVAGPAACSVDVTYGTIDRVNLAGPRIYSIVPQPVDTAILVWPEESGEPDCRNALLGSIRVNRAQIDGFPIGLRIHMRGDAQIGVLNTDLTGNHAGLEVVDSNAIVTVFGNRFASKAPGSYSCCEGGGTGMSVRNLADSAGATRLDVRDNAFDVSSGGFDSAWGIRLTRNPGATSVQPVFSNNHFELSGGEPVATAIWSHGVSGGLVSDNLVSWPLGSGLLLGITADSLGQADRWTVVSNRGLADAHLPSFEHYDIYLGVNTSNALIGPGQAAIVRDDGVNNTFLPQ